MTKIFVRDREKLELKTFEIEREGCIWWKCSRDNGSTSRWRDVRDRG